jgi:hypothetical protein
MRSCAGRTNGPAWYRPPRGTLAVRGSGGLTQGLQVVPDTGDRQAGGLGDLGGGLAVARQRLHLRAAGLTWPQRIRQARPGGGGTPAADRPVASAIWASAGTCSRRDGPETGVALLLLRGSGSRNRYDLLPSLISVKDRLWDRGPFSF